MVALFLVIIAGIRLRTEDADAAAEGMVSAASLGKRREIVVTGQVYQKDDLNYYLQDVSVSVQSLDEPEGAGSDLISNAGHSRQNISCKDNIICRLEEAQDIPLGRYVTLQGSFAPMAHASNPGEFDAAVYYRSLGVGGRLNGALLLGQGERSWPLREGLYLLRLSLRARLYRALSEEDAGIMCALLLGDRGGLDENVEDLYRQSGIMHILSISSLHVTILGISLYRLLRRLRIPVAPAAFGGCLLLLLYGCLTGFGVSACRAIGMYLIRMLGEAIGRTYDMLTALGVVGAAMLCFNPYYLQNSGFLLSFSSVLGVGVLCPSLLGTGKEERPGTEERNAVLRIFASAGKSLKQSAFASLSVVLATLPVQLRYYYEVPVYSVLINVLVLPFVRPLMLAGFVTAAFPGCGLSAVAVRGILGWYELLCALCAELPFHTWNPGCPKLWQAAVYYLVLGVLMLWRERKKGIEGGRSIEGERSIEGGKDIVGKKDIDRKEGVERKGRSLRGRGIYEGAATAAVLLFAVLFLGFRPFAENRVTFLDVGQGDCIVVQTESGETYLFDCGSSGRSGVGEYVLLPFLKYSGIRTLDAVFVSHPDEDHVSGIEELLHMGSKSGVTIRQLILPNAAEEIRARQLGALTEAARTARQKPSIDIRFVSAGDTWDCGSAKFTCLHPSAGWRNEDANTYSECFYVEFVSGKTATLLLTGDVEKEGEKALLEQLYDRNIKEVDVLKVAHHGSGGSTSEELLRLIRPRFAVISCGKDNRYGHPHRELLERLEKAGSTVLQTKEQGAVIIRFE